MSHIAGEFTALIGHTPLLDLRRYAQKRGLSAVLLAKLEYLKPRRQRQRPRGPAP